MPEIHLRQPRLAVLVDHSLKAKKEHKNLKKHGIHDTFFNTNQVKLAFNMTWLMEILRIFPRSTASGKVLPDKAFNILHWRCISKRSCFEDL